MSRIRTNIGAAHRLGTISIGFLSNIGAGSADRRWSLSLACPFLGQIVNHMGVARSQKRGSSWISAPEMSAQASDLDETPRWWHRSAMEWEKLDSVAQRSRANAARCATELSTQHLGLHLADSGPSSADPEKTLANFERFRGNGCRTRLRRCPQNIVDRALTASALTPCQAEV